MNNGDVEITANKVQPSNDNLNCINQPSTSTSIPNIPIKRIVYIDKVTG